MSAWIFDTCNASPLGEFQQSPLHERDAEGGKDGYIYQGKQGEENELEWINDTWMYRYAGDSWTERASHINKGTRWGMRTPAVGGAAYSMADGGRFLAAIRRYKPDGWIEMGKGPNPTMAYNGFQTYKGKIYGRIMGDFDEDRAAMFEYDTKQDTWDHRINATERFEWSRVHTATLGDKGYYYGGLKQFESEKAQGHTRHIRFSPNSNSYDTMQEMLDAIHNGVSGGLDGWAFLMGGVDSGGGVKSITRAYSPSKNSWKVWNGNQRRAASMPGARSIPASFILPKVNSIFVTGGSTRPFGQDVVHNTNFRFDPKKDSWQTMKKSIPTARFTHGAFAI